MAKDLKLYGIWMFVVALCVVFAIAVESPLPLLLPLTIPIALWVIRDYRNLFYLFFALVPFSIEYNFTPSLGTDLPSEPIMLLLFGIGLLLFFFSVFFTPIFPNILTPLPCC
ncbi:MAG: hypothetical protein IPN29_21405 [Saprospiraceae bacterium]|nr:hypothetical protein [Saprospiraceae bacterium]